MRAGVGQRKRDRAAYAAPCARDTAVLSFSVFMRMVLLRSPMFSVKAANCVDASRDSRLQRRPYSATIFSRSTTAFHILFSSSNLFLKSLPVSGCASGMNFASDTS